MLFFHRFDAVEDLEERELQRFRVSVCGLLANSVQVSAKCSERERERENILVQLRPRIFRHLLQVLRAPSRTHGSRIVFVEDLGAFGELDVWVFARHDDGAAGFAGDETGPRQVGAGGCFFVHGGGGRRYGGIVRGSRRWHRGVNGREGDGGWW